MKQYFAIMIVIEGYLAKHNEPPAGTSSFCRVTSLVLRLPIGSLDRCRGAFHQPVSWQSFSGFIWYQQAFWGCIIWFASWCMQHPCKAAIFGGTVPGTKRCICSYLGWWCLNKGDCVKRCAGLSLHTAASWFSWGNSDPNDGSRCHQARRLLSRLMKPLRHAMNCIHILLAKDAFVLLDADYAPGLHADMPDMLLSLQVELAICGQHIGPQIRLYFLSVSWFRKASSRPTK